MAWCTWLSRPWSLRSRTRVISPQSRQGNSDIGSETKISLSSRPLRGAEENEGPPPCLATLEPRGIQEVVGEKCVTRRGEALLPRPPPDLSLRWSVSSSAPFSLVLDPFLRGEEVVVEAGDHLYVPLRICPHGRSNIRARSRWVVGWDGLGFLEHLLQRLPALGHLAHPFERCVVVPVPLLVYLPARPLLQVSDPATNAPSYRLPPPAAAAGSPNRRTPCP